MAKLVRKTPSLKSQGAKYSVTNRKGETSYYASSKDVDAGKAPISTVGGTSKSDQLIGQSQTLLDQAKAMSGSIPAVSSKETPLNIPQPPAPSNIGNITDSGNAGIASLTGTPYEPGKGFANQTEESILNERQSLFDQANALRAQAYGEMPTGEEQLAKLEKENKLKQKQEAVNQYQAQLNAIVAKQQQDILRVEGQGRGIPEVIIGGQQAQINKEAAIAALPIQAQLAAAQGALDIAQSHIDKMFQIQSQDALAKFQYENKLIDTLYSFNDSQINKRLDIISAQKQRDYETQQDFLKTKRDLLSAAVQQGAPQSVVTGINNATTQEDAIRSAGEWGGDMLGQEAKRVSIQSARQQMALNQADLETVRLKNAQMQKALDSGEVVLDEEGKKTAMALGKQFEDESKNFKAQVDAYNRIIASSKNPSAAGDLSLIFAYMKMLDPTSVVRETEFANAQNAAGVPEKIRAQWNNVLRGERLTPVTRNDFVSRATDIYSTSLDQQIDLEDRFREQGTGVYGLPQEAVDLIVRDIRSQGAVSEVSFGLIMNQMSDDQLLDLRQSGLLSTPSGL